MGNKHKGSKVYFIGLWGFDNLGDVAIAVSTINFIKKQLPSTKIIFYNDIDFFKNIKKIKQQVKTDDIFVVMGGGNMGNLYPCEELCRQLIIKSFPYNKIVSFPQTLFFANDNSERWLYAPHYFKNVHGIDLPMDISDIIGHEKENFVDVYGQHRNLHIYAREYESFNQMKKLLPNGQIHLVPDIVLDYKEDLLTFKRKGVLLLLRHDEEKKISVSDENFIKNYFKDVFVEASDTLSASKSFELSKLKLTELLSKCKQRKLVVTDRLHGMIFAVITGTPCVALGNFNHKVSGVYEWLKDLDYVEYCERLEDFDNCVKKVLAVDSPVYPYEKMDEKFAILKREFNESNQSITPKISILVPVYNVEKTLKRCLDSLCLQTYSNIEIICVEDGSIDKSLEILEKYAKKDDRVKIIKHGINKGLWQARKSGIDNATGDYIMFVDSDDWIEKDACEILSNTILKYNTDIICFNQTLVNDGIKEKDFQGFIDYFSPKLENGTTLHKEEIMENCHEKHKFVHNLWNKIYKKNICIKAYRQILEEKTTWAEDLYASYLLYYYAKDFLYIDQKLYNYVIGKGISTKKTDSLLEINNLLQEIKLLDKVKEIYTFTSVSDYYLMCILNGLKNAIDRLIKIWIFKCDQKISAKIFDKITDTLGIVRTVKALSRNGYYDQDLISEKVVGSKCLKSCKKEIKTIAIYYLRLGNGGVERVISKISPIFLEAGYNVKIYVDQRNRDDEFEIDPRIEIKQIKAFNNYEDFDKRANEWINNLKMDDVDLVLYEASSNPKLIFDLMIIKSLGVYFVSTLHEIFSQDMCSLSKGILRRTKVLKLADRLHALSNTEKAFWENLGVKTTFIENPLTFNLKEIKPVELNGKNIIWLGRFDNNQKLPYEAIDIFNIVSEQIPDAKMFMLGKGETEEITQKVKNYIIQLGLENKIQTLYTTDVAPYYQKADIHFMTSAYESSPMVLGESMSYGLPCVVYDLPYVELLRNSKGCLRVPQKDKYACAEALVSLLNDRQRLKEMGKHAREKIIEYSHVNIMQKWNELFTEMISNNDSRITLENNYNRIILETMLFHYSIGVNRHHFESKSRKNIITIGGGGGTWSGRWKRFKHSLKVHGLIKTTAKIFKKIHRKIFKR